MPSLILGTPWLSSCWLLVKAACPTIFVLPVPAVEVGFDGLPLEEKRNTPRPEPIIKTSSTAPIMAIRPLRWRPAGREGIDAGKGTGGSGVCGDALTGACDGGGEEGTVGIIVGGRGELEVGETGAGYFMPGGVFTSAPTVGRSDADEAMVGVLILERTVGKSDADEAMGGLSVRTVAISCGNVEG